MKLLMPWIKFPAKSIATDNSLRHITWSEYKSAGIAALQIYIVLCLRKDDVEDDEGNALGVAKVSYTALEDMAGLSRAMVAKGVDTLRQIGMIHVEKQGKESLYRIVGYNPHKNWAKMPCRELLNKSGDQIPAFRVFNKRSKDELNALKIFLLAICIRQNDEAFAMCSYEKIYEKTGVAEKDIRRAIAFLLNARLFSNIDQSQKEGSKQKEPNKYYVQGYRSFFIAK